MNTETANAITASNAIAQYDIGVKRVLAQKSILAYILINTVNEYRGMKPEDVVACIEGEPMVGTVPVEPGLTNAEYVGADGSRVVGFNTENAEINEGMIRFDIVFYVRMKSGISKIIINVEAQKDEPKKYGILNRAVFYASRLISSQKERDFVNTSYDDIKQVFSIWICMNTKYNSLSHIHLVKDEMLEENAWRGRLDLLNVVILGVTKELPKQEEKYELHRLISALLSDKMEIKEKLNLLEEEYKIPIDDGIRKDVGYMCNLGEGINERAEERAEKRTFEKVIMNMYRNDYTLDQITVITGKTKEEIEQVIRDNELVMA